MYLQTLPAHFPSTNLSASTSSLHQAQQNLRGEKIHQQPSQNCFKMTKPGGEKNQIRLVLWNRPMRSEVGETFSAGELQEPVKKRRILSVFSLAVLTADVF